MIGIITALSFLELGIAKYVVIAGSKDEWTRNHKKDLRAQGFKGQVRATGAPEIWGPTFGRIGAVCEHSMFASRHMHEYGATERQFGTAATQSRPGLYYQNGGTRVSMSSAATASRQ